jgi:hypothetical protein
LRAVKLETGERLETFTHDGGEPPRPARYRVLKKTATAFVQRNGDPSSPASRPRSTKKSASAFAAAHNEAFGRPVVWSHTAYANRCVFARNDKEIVCASLAP